LRPSTPLYLSKPGLICCAGPSLEAFLCAALLKNTRGIAPSTLCLGNKTYPFLIGRATPSAQGPSRLLSLCATALQPLLPIVQKALQRYGPQNLGLCLGSCDNGTEASTPAHQAFFLNGTFPPGYALPLQSAARPAEFAAQLLGLKGPVLALATACASSASAIIRAAQLVASGVCAAVVAGGVDIASEVALLGFSALEAVSPELCNPFSKNRKGINLGEGAAFFLLSRERLEEEGEGVVLAGFGESADAHHMTAPHPQGLGAAAAMQAALLHAGIAPGEIGYVNLHGTGTLLNDEAEAKAMYAIFGDKQPPASATKPITGHTLGAAGALELALCWGVLQGDRTQVGVPSLPPPMPALPPHCWDGAYDTSLPPLRFVQAEGVESPQALQYCMSNAFAFGGCNTSLILRRGGGP